MKIALLTDSHAGVRNDSQIFAEHQGKFFRDIFFPYIDQQNIEHVIHLGDILDRRKFCNFKTLQNLRDQLLIPLQERSIETHVIIGNHDTFLKSSNEINSPGLLFDSFSNITSYPEATTLKFDGVDIALLPWICADNFADSMDFIKETPAQILMGHLEIRGFPMYLGATVDHGFDPAIFDRFDTVYSGHFHHKSSNGNITYLGAPYEMTWADYNDSRGFHVFDTDTRELTRIENPHKVFYKVYYNDDQNDIEEILKEDFSCYKNCYVKIVVQHKSNPYNFERLVKLIEDQDPADVSFTDDTFDVMFNDEELEDVEDTRAIITNSILQTVPERLQQRMEVFVLQLHSEALNTTTI